MTRRQKDPLRPLTEEECAMLLAISRSRTEPAAHVERARLILAVADGARYTAAAHSVGRRCNDPVADLVRRCNHEGVSAIEPGHGGGAAILYGADARERVLREFRR
ncbi:MAG: helix-turn-helix domain-containing protein, partial [Oscillochloris sp.]|nr:helix-turn-helix domain-containing protein [Oscillochloris sp.]